MVLVAIVAYVLGSRRYMQGTSLRDGYKGLECRFRENLGLFESGLSANMKMDDGRAGEFNLMERTMTFDDVRSMQDGCTYETLCLMILYHG